MTVISGWLKSQDLFWSLLQTRNTLTTLWICCLSSENQFHLLDHQEVTSMHVNHKTLNSSFHPLLTNCQMWIRNCLSWEQWPHINTHIQVHKHLSKHIEHISHGENKAADLSCNNHLPSSSFWISDAFQQEIPDVSFSETNEASSVPDNFLKKIFAKHAPYMLMANSRKQIS